MRVVICGGGVIGAATAYYLAGRGADVTVVETNAVAGAASGRSGAFVARDWATGSPLDPLARHSFDLHVRLLDEIDGDWQYHGVTTYGGFVVPADDIRRNNPSELSWVADGVVVSSILGTPETTAVMHPARFTTALMDAARARGAELRHGRVTGLARRAAGSSGTTVDGVEVDGEVLRADAVVIALGPWSLLAAEWLPLPPLYPDRGHSLVFDTGSDIPPASLFVEYPDETGNILSPELFVRADGTTYVTLGTGGGPLPLDPSLVEPVPEMLSLLERICERISPVLTPSRIVQRTACFRPVSPDSLPVIGPLQDVDGAYIASGHSVWGMLNGPATGEALAELIVEGVAHSTDLTPFDPRRLPRSTRPSFGSSRGRCADALPQP